MKVLSVYYTHKPGGFCKRLYRLLNAMQNSGHEVHYLCLDAPPNTWISLFSPPAIALKLKAAPVAALTAIIYQRPGIGFSTIANWL